MKKLIDNATLYLQDCNNIIQDLPEFDILVYDPPFDTWDSINVKKAKTIIAFCSPQSRHHVEEKLGRPRTEIVWHFEDGRWVSPNLPRITHSYIYIYGDVGKANVGDNQEIKTQKKGKSSIGKDCLGERIYTSKKRKHLNSVQIFPKNMNSSIGAWGKPINLMIRLLEWVEGKSVLDPFMGSGTTGVACVKLGYQFTGIEIDRKHFNTSMQRIQNAYAEPDLFVKQDEYIQQEIRI